MERNIFLLTSLLVFGSISAEKCITKSNSKLFCYYGKVQSVDNCKCTHIILPANSDVKSIETLKKSVDGVKILVTVHEFNKGLVELLKNSKVDGLEIDLKKIDSKTDIGDFITTVKSKLGSELTTVVSIPSKGDLLAKFYDFKGLSKHADAFILQTAFLGASKNFTFHPSRLSGLWDMQNADSLVDLVTGLGAPLSKLVISVPVQAFQFKLQNEKHTAVGSPALEVKSIGRDELCEKTSNFNWTLERDEDQAGPYIFRNNEWIAFEDDISIDIKAKYARIRGLNGLALKDLSQDGGSKNCGYTLLDSAHKGLSKRARAPRGAVLHSLEREILDNYGAYAENNHISVSPYRISRIIDVEGKIHTVRQDTRTEFACSRQGYFVHPRSCNRFYRCVKFDQQADDFNVFEFDCPAGLAFDEKVEVCVWPGSVSKGGPCSGSSEIAPVPKERYVCPHEPGYYADPENCRWFFACLDHGNSIMTPYEFRCPFGLVFDQEHLVCEWPWLVPKCLNGHAGIYQPSVVVYGSNSLENYNGLGVLQPVRLHGVIGAIEEPINKVYSNFGNNGNVVYVNSDLGGHGLSNSQGQQLDLNGFLSKDLGTANYEYQSGQSNAGQYLAGQHEGSIGILGKGLGRGKYKYQHGAGEQIGSTAVLEKDIGLGNYGYQHGAGEQIGSIAILGKGLDTGNYRYQHGTEEQIGSAAILGKGLGTGNYRYQHGGGEQIGSTAILGKDLGTGNYRYQQGGGEQIGSSAILGKGLGTGNYRYQHGGGEQGASLGIFTKGLGVGSSGETSQLLGVGNKEFGATSAGEYNKNFFASETDDDFNAQNLGFVTNSKNYGLNNVGFSTGGFSHGFQVNSNNLNQDLYNNHRFGTKNVDIVAGGFSAVKNYNRGTISPIVSISPTPSSIPTVTSVPLPSKVDVYQGGVIANIPELQVKVHSPHEVIRHGNVSTTNVDLSGEYVYDKTENSYQSKGYNYPIPSVIFEEKPISNGYYYPKPSVKFEEGSYSYQDINKDIAAGQGYIQSVTPTILTTSHGGGFETATPSVLLGQQLKSKTIIEPPRSYSYQSFGKTSNLNQEVQRGSLNDKHVQILQPTIEVEKPTGTYIESVTPSILHGGQLQLSHGNVQTGAKSDQSYSYNYQNVGNEQVEFDDQRENGQYIERVKPVSTFNINTFGKGNYDTIKVGGIQSVTPVPILVDKVEVQPQYNIGVQRTHNFQTFGDQKLDTVVQSVTPSILIESKGPELQPGFVPQVKVQQPVSTYNFQTFHKSDYGQKLDTIKSVTPSVLFGTKENVEIHKPVSSYTFGHEIGGIQSVTPTVLIQPQHNVEVHKPATSYGFQSFGKNDYSQKAESIQSVTPTVLIQEKQVEIQPQTYVELQKPVSNYNFQTFHKSGYGQKLDTIQSITPAILIQNKELIEAHKPVSTYSFQSDFGQKVDAVQSVTPTTFIQDKVQPQHVEVHKPATSYSFQSFGKSDYGHKAEAIQSVTPTVFIENKQVEIQPEYKVEIQPQAHIEVQKPVSSYDFQTHHSRGYKQKIDTVSSVTPSILIEGKPQFEIHNPVSSYSFGHKIDAVQSVTPTVLIQQKQVEIQPQTYVEFQKPASNYNFQTFHKSGYGQKLDTIQSVTPSVLIQNKATIEAQKPISTYSFQSDFGQKVDAVQSVRPTTFIQDSVQPHVEVHKPATSYSFQSFGKSDYGHKVEAIQSVTPTVLIENKQVEIQPEYKVEIQPQAHIEVQKPVSSYDFQTHHNRGYEQKIDTVSSVTPSILIEGKPQFEIHKPISSYSFDHKIDAVQSVTPAILIQDKQVELQPHPVEIQKVELQPQTHVKIQKPVSNYNFQTFHKSGYDQKLDTIQSITPSVLIENKPISSYSFGQKVDAIQSVTPAVLTENKYVDVQPQHHVEIHKPVTSYSFQTFDKNHYKQKVDTIQSVTPTVLLENKQVEIQPDYQVEPQITLEVEKPVSNYNYQTFYKTGSDQKLHTIQSITPSVLIGNKEHLEVHKPISTYSFGQKVGIQPDYKVEIQPQTHIEVEKPISNYNFQTFHKSDYDQTLDTIQSVTPSIIVENKENVEAHKPIQSYSFQSGFDHNVGTFQSVTPTVLIQDEHILPNIQPQYHVDAQQPISSYTFQNDYGHQTKAVETVTPTVLIEDKYVNQPQFKLDIQPQIAIEKDYNQKVDTIQNVTPAVLVEHKDNIAVQPEHAEVKDGEGYSYQTFGNAYQQKQESHVQKPVSYFKYSFGTQVDQNKENKEFDGAVVVDAKLEPVSEVPFVRKNAYVTGDHYYDQKSKLLGTYTISSTPDAVQTYQSTLKPEYFARTSPRVYLKTPTQSIIVPTTEKLFYTTSKPTYQTVLTSEKSEPLNFYFHDSRLSTTPEANIESYDEHEGYISTTPKGYYESSSKDYLPPRTHNLVTTTAKPFLEVTTPYVEVSSVPLGGTVVESYENKAARRPVKVVKVVRPKSKAIVKFNDFYPMLSTKLGAQCTCVSNTLNLRKRPDVNTQYYDTIDNDDDGYVVDDYQSNLNDYDSQKVVEITQIPLTNKLVEISPISTTLPYKPLQKTKVIEVFTAQPNVDDDEEPSDKEIKQAVKTGLKLIKSAAKQGAKEGTKVAIRDFDRYGPGGVRSRLETLQGIDCQRAGLFRHPTQCNKFYSCVYDCDKKKFKLHIFNCPVHLTFDNNIGACNWPSKGPACMGDTLLPSE